MSAISTKRPVSAYYLLLAGVLLQGLSPVLTKLLLGYGLAQETVVASRYALALVLFLPLIGLTGAPEPLRPPRRQDWVALLLVGVLGSGVAGLLFTWALTYSTAGVVHALSKTAPLFVAVLAYLALREQVTPARVSLVLAMVLASLLMAAGDLVVGGEEARQRLLGDLLAIGAGVCRAVAEILAKGVLRRFRPAMVGAARVAGGLLVGGLALAVTGAGGELAALPVGAWVVLGTLATVSTVGSLHLYYRGLASVPVHVAEALKLISVMVTVVVSWVWLAEALNLLHLAGVAVLLAGAHLLILRTPLRGAAPLLEEAAEALPSAGPGRLRRRLTVVAAGILIAVVTPATYLMARHATELVYRETELAMSNVAATVLGSVAAQPTAPPQAHERFLQNLVRTRVEGATYSVEVAFALLQDAPGAVLALAYNEAALPELAPPAGRPSRAEAIAQLQALARDPTRAAERGLVVVQATWEEGPRPLTVTLGCRQQAARHLIHRIIARHAALGLLILLTGLVTLWVGLGRALQPLTELLHALDHVSRGRLHYPVLPRSPAVGELAGAVDQIRQGLVRGEQWREAALRMATGRSLSRGEQPAGLTYLAVPAAALDVLTPEDRERILTRILEHEGMLEGTCGGALIASWGRAGAEQDDLLRAALAALEVHSELAEGVSALPAVSGDLEAVARLAGSGEASGGETPLGPAVWVRGEETEALEPLIAAGEFRLAEEATDAAGWMRLTWTEGEPETGEWFDEV